MGFKEQIDSNRLPEHIAIIMDGNADGQKIRVSLGFLVMKVVYYL